MSAMAEWRHCVDANDCNGSVGISTVKAWRIYLHKTQKEMAAALHITQGAFSQMEKSDHNQAVTLERIAKGLNIQPEQLMI